jgi:hypothetical protein
MTLILNILLALIIQSANIGEYNIAQIRNAYYAALENSKSADDFSKLFKEIKNVNDPLIKGYKGMSEMILSRHAFNPYSKLNYFYKGRDLLEEAINADPKNTELLFLRFSVQTNCPGFLNYSTNISQDKQALIDFLVSKNQKDKDLSEKITSFLLHSKHVKEEEKTKLKK